jgi:hypothetical protein
MSISYDRPEATLTLVSFYLRSGVVKCNQINPRELASESKAHYSGWHNDNVYYLY